MTSRVRSMLLPVAVFAVVLMALPAVASSGQDGAVQGYSNETPVPQEAVVVAVPPADTAPAVPPVETAQPAQEDPCAAYAGNPSAHAVCTDRIEKIRRMKEAATQRDEDLRTYYKRLRSRTAPAAQAATAPAVPQAQPVASTTPATPTQVPGTNVYTTPEVPQAAGTVNLTPYAPPPK